MSKFYSKYCECNGKTKPLWLENEERLGEINGQRIIQARITTTGKHTGSKNKKQISYNISSITTNMQRFERLSTLFKGKK